MDRNPIDEFYYACFENVGIFMENFWIKKKLKKVSYTILFNQKKKKAIVLNSS